LLARKVLLISLSDVASNPRPNRASKALHRAGFNVHILAPYPKNEQEQITKIYPLFVNRGIWNFRFFRVFGYRIYWTLGAFELTHSIAMRFFWRLVGAFSYLPFIRRENYDLILVEDLHFLPGVVGYINKPNSTIYDCREYFPAEYTENTFLSRLHNYRGTLSLKKNVHKIHSYYTVSDGLRGLYCDNFKQCPYVIFSVPEYKLIEPINTKNYPLKLVYHGAADRSRSLEDIIEATIYFAGKFTLDLFLVGDDSYQRSLERSVAGSPWVNFKSPVRMENIVTTLNNYDVGLCFFPPLNKNLENCLPNKFFEYVQARLAVLCGPTPDMVRLIQIHKFGWYTNGFSLNDLISLMCEIDLDGINTCKSMSNVAARQLCWEVESEKLIELANRVISN
jgi:hypothetical protein